MAKTHWLFVFDTFVISCISLALLIVSCATNEWLISEVYVSGAKENSEIVYGLFSGSLTRNLLSTPLKYDLTVTCDYGEGVCFYSCHDTSENRHKELENILNGVQDTSQCTPQSKSLRMLFNDEQLMNNMKKLLTPDGNGMKAKVDDDTESPKPYEQLIGSGYWVCTVMFLIISIIFTTIAGVLSLINVVLNPVESIFSTFGLYIWNGISAGSCLLTLIIWGSLYDISLAHNIAISDTLTLNDVSSDGLANLGYSYFIIIVPLLLSLTNIGLLLIRNYLLSKEPVAPIIPVQDTGLIFY